MYFSHSTNCTVSWFAHLIYDTAIPPASLKHLYISNPQYRQEASSVFCFVFFLSAENECMSVQSTDFSTEEYFSCQILRLWVHAKLFQSCPTLCDPMDYTPTRLLCPCDAPGKNTGVGCHALLQGIFLMQGLNMHLFQLLHCRQILYHWATGEAPCAYAWTRLSL